jgi:hypothetical protein
MCTELSDSGVIVPVPVPSLSDSETLEPLNLTVRGIPSSSAADLEGTTTNSVTEIALLAPFKIVYLA